VPDTPVWLDTLIAQLLEKEPAKRPRDAELVSQALSQVAEKMAARQSAGVDAVRARAIDRPRGASPVDETDKAAARTLREAVTGKKARKKKKPIFKEIWAQAIVLVALLVFAVGILYWALQPTSPDKLYQQAERLAKSNDPDERDRALGPDGPITAYFKHYARRQDKQAQDMRDWADHIREDQCDRKLGKLLRSHKTAGFMKPQEGVETQALSAAVAEDVGDLAKAHKVWQEVWQAHHEESGEALAWAMLAEKRRNQVMAAEMLADKIDTAVKSGKDPVPANAQEQQLLIKCSWALTQDQLLAKTWDCVKDAAPAKARECWDEVRTKYQDDSTQRVVVLLAADRLVHLKKAETAPPEKSAPDKKPKDKAETPAKGSS
jgi:hypothetical protein